MSGGLHAFYLDEDAAGQRTRLEQLGYGFVLATSELRRGSTDAQQLARAQSLGRTLVTFNRRDYLLVHEAWLLAGGHHSGILTSTQYCVDLADAVDEVCRVRTAESLRDELAIWDPIRRTWTNWR